MSTRRAITLTRNLTAATFFAAAIFAGQASASTMEEIIVHGKIVSAETQRQHFEAEMAAYLSSVDSELKNSVRQHLERTVGPKLRLAEASRSNRG
jgi:hypothetical protein